MSDGRGRSFGRGGSAISGHDDRQRRRHALEGHRQLAEQLAVGLDPHGAGCGHRGAAGLQIGDPRQAEVRAALSYATQMNGLADEQDLRLRFDVLTKTKQPELCRYWTTRDRAANVRLFRLAAEVLQAIASSAASAGRGGRCEAPGEGDERDNARDPEIGSRNMCGCSFGSSAAWGHRPRAIRPCCPRAT